MVAIAHLLANRLPVITMEGSPSWAEDLAQWCAVQWQAFLEWCKFPLFSTNLAKHTDTAPEIFTPSPFAGLSHSVSSSSSFSVDVSDRLVPPLACVALHHLHTVRWPNCVTTARTDFCGGKCNNCTIEGRNCTFGPSSQDEGAVAKGAEGEAGEF